MTLTVSLRPEPTQPRLPKPPTSPAVLKRHKAGAVRLCPGRYIGIIELKEQQDTESSKKVMTLVIRYLIKNEENSMKLARSEHAKKNIIIIDFLHDKTQPTIITAEEKFDEIVRIEEQIQPKKLFPILKIKRPQKEFQRHPEKGEFKKLHIAEGFFYGRMPDSEYERLQFSKK